MANTVIALKKSATPSSVPSNLANGELAINYADGKLYYKAANGTIASISGNEPNYFGTVNANNTLVVADTPGDVFTLASGNNIAITGDAVNDKITVGLTNDVILPGTLTLGAVGGDEGGELKLANALTNSVLSGKVVIDIYQNKLRFYEEAGTNRGAYIDLSAASGGVATDLLAGSSGTDTIARQWATGAFDKANNAYAHANAAFDAANNAVTDFSPAFIQANTARVHSNAAFASANAGQATANAAFDKANTANITADLAFIHANAAFFKANNAVTDFSPAFNQANTARDHANASYAFANSSHIVSNLSFIHANAAFDKANTANITADLAFIHANAAFDAANNAVTDFSPAFNQANLAYAQANTARDHANAAFLSSNSVNTYSDSTYVKLSATSQTITGNLSIVGNLTLSGNTIFLNATRLQVDDPLIYLAGNNYTSDIVDIGFIANYVNATGQNVHTGLYREHENKEYYLFQGYDKEPINNHIGALSNNMTLAVLNADLKTSNIILGGANAILTIGASFNHANAAHASANAGMAISNAAFAAANAGLLQANTARDHANAAFNKANTAVTDFSPAFLTANIAYAHANAAFNKANAALSNTSGAAFNGNLNLPTGNLAVGIATPNTGARLQVYNTTGNSELWITADNGYDPVLRMTGEAGATNEGFYIQYDNSVGDTYFKNIFNGIGAFHFETAVVEAFTIRTDGKVGVGTTTPQHILDVKGVANVSSALLVNDMNVKPTITAAFNTANAAFLHANAAFATVNSAFGIVNTAVQNTATVTFVGTSNNSLYAYGKQENQLSVASAATLTSARSIGDTSFNGSADIIPSRITYKDTRSVNFAPITSGNTGLTLHLKTNATDGLNDGGTYHGILHLQQWSDISGGNPHQLGFTDNGNVYLRTATNATAWGTWRKMWHDANDGAGSGLDADLLDGQQGSYYGIATDVTAANRVANAAFLHANAAFNKANTAGGGAAYFTGNNGDVGNATGLGDIFRVVTKTLSANVTIYSGNNAIAAGPITIAPNGSLTIQNDSRVAIV